MVTNDIANSLLKRVYFDDDPIKLDTEYKIVVSVMADTIEHQINIIRMLVIALDKQTAELKTANQRIERLNKYVRKHQLCQEHEIGKKGNE